MSLLVYNLVMILGALCVFIYGMRLMSEGIQRAAGKSLRRILRSITANRYRGLATGLFTTAAIQSSSATTVMTVSLVNAGLITLTQSVGVMLGANIGTTSTAWIISLLGFRLDVYQLTLPLFLVGLPLVIRQRGRLKAYGEFAIGVAILFLGLRFLQDTVPDLGQDIEMITWIGSLTDSGILTRIVFVAIGALMTIVIQSSSAAIVLTMTMCMQGLIPIELGACLVLGENVGTTVTAEVASLVGNVHARRSARVHTLFNVFGVSWMVIVLPYFLPSLEWLQQRWLGALTASPDGRGTEITLALFHTLFNVSNVIICLILLPYLVRLAIRTVQPKTSDDEISRLKFFNEAGRTPELAIIELRQEISKYVNIVYRMHGFSFDMFNALKKKKRAALQNRIDKYEDITDNINGEIGEYITTISRDKLSASTSQNLRIMLSVCNELERIGDGYRKISEDISYKAEHKIWINPTQRNNLNTFIDFVGAILLGLERYLSVDQQDTISIETIASKVSAAKVYHRHIKDPVVMDMGLDPEDGDIDNLITIQSAKVYDNLLYEYNKILSHCQSILQALSDRTVV